MGLVICVSKTKALNTSTLSEQVCGICENVVSDEDQLHFVPQPGKLIALLAILNEAGIDYDFQPGTPNDER